MSIAFESFVLNKELVILSEAKDLFPVEPRFTQVFPSRVLRFNQRSFLSPQPAFDRFFAGDGIADVLERFIVNQTMNFVIAGESRIDVVLVLPSAAIDVVGDAGVKHSRFAGQNVNVEVAHGKQVLRSA